MAVDEAEDHEMTTEELRSRLEDEGVTLTDLLEVDELRTPIVKALARRDIEEHRDIYDRLAES